MVQHMNKQAQKDQKDPTVFMVDSQPSKFVMQENCMSELKSAVTEANTILKKGETKKVKIWKLVAEVEVVAETKYREFV